jgi:aldose 1-epimerase
MSLTMEAVDTVEISGHGLTARLIPRGATLVELRMEGHEAPLTLGLADRSGYAAGEAGFMGATVGRVANRIGRARFELGGRTYRTDPNFLGRHTLHGGAQGFHARDWDIYRQDAASCGFHLTSPDGEMGFPGTLQIEARYTLRAPMTLEVEYLASSNALTLCAPAHHSYWNLDGSDDIRHHRLWLEADRYLPVDDELIPTGVASVEGSCYDFRRGAPPMGCAGALDHNLCLSDGRVRLRQVGKLRSDLSGVEMSIATTEPGIQVYDGAKLDRPGGLGGRHYRAHAGLALEPQAWPDAAHHAGFPLPVLRPGACYHQITTFSFRKA